MNKQQQPQHTPATSLLQTTVNHGELSIFMPLSIKKRPGCKTLMAPPDATITQKTNPTSSVYSATYMTSTTNHTLRQALIKAHLWQRQLTQQKYQSLREISRETGSNFTYMLKVFRLTLLAPRIKEAIINGTQPRQLKLTDLIHHLPLLWSEQYERYGMPLPDRSDDQDDKCSLKKSTDKSTP